MRQPSASSTTLAPEFQHHHHPRHPSGPAPPPPYEGELSFFFFVIYFMELGVFSATQIVLDIGLVAVFLGVLLSLSAGYSTCGLTCNVVPTGRIILKA